VLNTHKIGRMMATTTYSILVKQPDKQELAKLATALVWRSLLRHPRPLSAGACKTRARGPKARHSDCAAPSALVSKPELLSFPSALWRGRSGPSQVTRWSELSLKKFIGANWGPDGLDSPSAHVSVVLRRALGQSRTVRRILLQLLTAGLILS
jgi:hypothetical protein